VGPKLKHIDQAKTVGPGSKEPPIWAPFSRPKPTALGGDSATASPDIIIGSYESRSHPTSTTLPQRLTAAQCPPTRTLKVRQLSRSVTVTSVVIATVRWPLRLLVGHRIGFCRMHGGLESAAQAVAGPGRDRDSWVAPPGAELAVEAGEQPVRDRPGETGEESG
jgi:hypothetical protein